MFYFIYNDIIKVHELNNPKRFEAAGLGITDVSQIEYYGPEGMYFIYSGEWHSNNRKIIKRIIPKANVDVFGIYYEMVQNIEQKILERRNQNECSL